MLTTPDNGPAVVKPNGKAYSFNKPKEKKVPLMLTYEYSRPIPAADGLRTLVSPTWTESNKDKRTLNGKRFTGTSHCVSYRKDSDGNIVDAQIFTGRKNNRTPRRYSESLADKDKSLQAGMGTIHTEPI